MKETQDLPVFQPMTPEREERIRQFIATRSFKGDVNFTNHIGFRRTTFDKGVFTMRQYKETPAKGGSHD